MRLKTEVVKDAAIGVGVAPTLEALSAIHHTGCAAVLWRRQLAPELGAWLADLPQDHLPKARVILQADRVKETFTQICEMSCTPDGPERRMLIDDVAQIAKAFAALLQAPYLRLRFDVVTTNACRRFHIDALKARLVCTYRGTGTQYGISVDGAEPSRVFTVPTGVPMVMRGTHWPELPRSGLLHRSPPIEGTGEVRSVLVLDPIFDLEQER